MTHDTNIYEHAYIYGVIITIPVCKNVFFYFKIRTTCTCCMLQKPQLNRNIH